MIYYSYSNVISSLSIKYFLLHGTLAVIKYIIAPLSKIKPNKAEESGKPSAETINPEIVGPINDPKEKKTLYNDEAISPIKSSSKSL